MRISVYWTFPNWGKWKFVLTKIKRIHKLEKKLARNSERVRLLMSLLEAKRQVAAQGSAPQEERQRAEEMIVAAHDFLLAHPEAKSVPMRDIFFRIEDGAKLWEFCQFLAFNNAVLCDGFLSYPIASMERSLQNLELSYPLALQVLHQTYTARGGRKVEPQPACILA